MNDLESKLRALTFREPPPGWRASMAEVAVPQTGWRTWFAPHPAAWGALAAIWVILALISRSYEKPPADSPTLAASRVMLSEPALIAAYFQSAAGRASE